MYFRFFQLIRTLLPVILVVVFLYANFGLASMVLPRVHPTLVGIVALALTTWGLVNWFRKD